MELDHISDKTLGDIYSSEMMFHAREMSVFLQGSTMTRMTLNPLASGKPLMKSNKSAQIFFESNRG